MIKITIAALFLFALLWPAAPVSSVSSVFAATFTVNTASDTIDINPGNGVCADTGGNCSLRAAISEANALAGADTINIPAGTFTHSLVATNDNSNAGGDWDVTSQITINGAGAGATILQAAASPGSATERVIEVTLNGNLTLTNVTVRHGRVTTGSLAGGGGIANFGALSLNGVTVRDNQAGTSVGTAIGGGIYSDSASLTIANSTVTANVAAASSPGAGFGGGVASSAGGLAAIVITNSAISGNSLNSIGSPSSGGGLYVGGVFNLTATDSHFDDNMATGTAGSEGGGARLVSIVGPSTFNISGCTFNNNTSASSAVSAVGGGLHLYTSAAPLTGTLDKVSIDGNRAQGTVQSRGGGLYVNPVGAAINVDITNSSISQNTNDGSRGGGVELSDRFSTTAASSTVNFTNTTISGNGVGTGGSGVQGNGGGAHIEMTTGPMTVNFNFTTIAENLAFSDGGGIAHVPGNSTVSVKNSIVAGNGAGDISGTLVSQNFNHIENPGGGIFVPAANDTSGFDPQLGALQNNGGPTLTHLLAAASPLVNVIPNGLNGCGTNVSTDQRGLPRPALSRCDIGASELQSFSGGPFSVSGTVLTDGGIPIRNVVVVLSEGGLSAPRFTVTGSLGNYQFTNVTANGYTISISSKKYVFAEDGKFINVISDLTNVNFSGVPATSRKSFLEMVKRTSNK